MDSVHCRILCCHSADLPRAWHVDLASPFWRAYLHSDDGVIFNTETQEFTPKANTWWIIPAWCPATGHTSQALTQHYIHFDPLGLDPVWLRAHCRAPQASASALLKPAAIPDLFLAFQHAEATAHFSILSHISSCLGELLTAHPAISNPAASDDNLLTSLQQAIDSDIASPWPIERLLALTGLSERWLRQRLRRSAGVSPLHFVQQRRIRRASELLLLSSHDIEQIAEQCGFANRHHFSRIFSKTVGLAPARYRRQGFPETKEPEP